MTTFSRRALLGTAIATASVGVAAAHGTFTAGSLRVELAWSRAAGQGGTGVGYLTIRNGGTAADRLVSARSPAAPEVQLHNHVNDNGVMRMRQVEGGIDIPAGGTVVLQPSGLHVMMIGLAAPLRQGTHVPLTLVFEKAGTLEVQLTVEGAGARAPSEAGGRAAPASGGHAH